MANNLMTFENVVENIVPKITIQRIVLETSATDIPSDPKNPHATPPDIPDAFKDPDFSIGEDPDKLKVNLTLSLKGFKSKSLDANNPLSVVFDNLDLMSMVKSSIYQITSFEDLGKARKFFEIGGQTNPTGGLGSLGTGLSKQSFDDLTITEIYQSIMGLPNLFNKQEIIIGEELGIINAGDSQDGNLFRYQNTDSNGSVTYDFPFKLEPYLLEKNVDFLAFLVVTEIDADSLISNIAARIGGSSDYVLPTEVEEYIMEYNNNISNKTMSLDVVINNGIVSKTAALLKRDDNQKYWFGPYHQMPNGNLMTGVIHNDKNLALEERDKLLLPVLLANTKIVDLRDDEEIEKVLLKEVYEIESLYDELAKSSKQMKKSDKNTLNDLPEKFSSSLSSKHPDGTFSCMFGVDKLKILKHKSSLPGVAQNLASLDNQDLDIIKEILDATTIKNIKILRRRIKISEFGTNRLGTLNPEQESFMHNFLNADISNSYEDSKFIEVASKEENQENQTVKTLEAFNFLDTSTKEKRFIFHSFRDYFLASLDTGNYEYSYEMLLDDGIAKVMTDKLQSLMSSQKKIKEYLKFIEQNIVNCYDEPRDQFNKNFIDSTDFSSIGADLQTTVDDLLNIVRMFNAKTQYTQFGENMVLIAHPESGNFQGLMKFVKIVDSFIEKIQELPGIKTGLEKYLDLAVTDLNNGAKQLPDTIMISETFPMHANLDVKGTGYEYIIPTTNVQTSIIPSSINSLTTIPYQTFQSIIESQLQENFELNYDNTSFGSPSNSNLPRHFTPAQVFVNKKRYKTNSAPEIAGPDVPKPYHLNFDFYKPIILDIIEYYLTKQSQGNFIQPDAKANIVRLIDIASHYGIRLQDDFIDQLQFLADPSVDTGENNNQFYDSSNAKNLQQQSGKNVNTSGIDFEDETNPASDYEDQKNIVGGITSIPGSEVLKNPNIENLLFGMLSNIILQDEIPLTNIYSNPFGENILSITDIPIPIQSLFVQFDKLGYGADFKKYLVGIIASEYIKFQEFPVSLSTIGWWWFNYSNIVEVRYIEEYDNLFNPVWAPLTLEAMGDTLAQGKKIVCRLYGYQNPSLGIVNNNRFLDLPIFNENFIIQPLPDFQILSSQQEQATIFDEEDDADLKQSAIEALEMAAVMNVNNLNSLLITDRLVITNQNAKQMTSNEIRDDQALGRQPVNRDRQIITNNNNQRPTIERSSRNRLTTNRTRYTD